MPDLELISTTDTDEQVNSALGITAEPEKKEEVEKELIAEEVPEADEEDETPQPAKKKGGFQKRIDKLTREKAELEAKVASLTTPKKDEPAEEAAPDPLFFESQADYIAALVKFETKKAKEEAKAEIVAEAKKEAEKKEVEAKTSTWQTRVQDAHKAHPDLAELLEQDLPVSPMVNDVLIESEIGGELLYYLASNPDELAEISKKGPIAAAKALGLIEDRLLKTAEKKPEPPAVKVTQAKRPITPITGGKGSGGVKSPDDMSLEEYRAWRESQS